MGGERAISNTAALYRRTSRILAHKLPLRLAERCRALSLAPLLRWQFRIRADATNIRCISIPDMQRTCRTGQICAHRPHDQQEAVRTARRAHLFKLGNDGMNCAAVVGICLGTTLHSTTRLRRSKAVYGSRVGPAVVNGRLPQGPRYPGSIMTGVFVGAQAGP